MWIVLFAGWCNSYCKDSGSGFWCLSSDIIKSSCPEPRNYWSWDRKNRYQKTKKKGKMQILFKHRRLMWAICLGPLCIRQLTDQACLPTSRLSTIGYRNVDVFIWDLSFADWDLSNQDAWLPSQKMKQWNVIPMLKHGRKRISLSSIRFHSYWFCLRVSSQ